MSPRNWFPCLLFASVAAWSAPPLLICLPEGQPPSRISSVLEEAALSRSVMAFQRVKDLEEVLSTYPGSPIISSAAYVRLMPGYTVLLRGKRSSEKQERYLIISARPDMTRAEAAAGKVAILDFLGREKLPDFVKEAFGFPIAKLKRVNKKQDLQSLLGMEAVDAAIIESSYFAEMQSGTKVKLSIIVESKLLDNFPVFAAPDPPGNDDLRRKLMALPKSALSVLGIEGWE